MRVIFFTFLETGQGSGSNYVRHSAMYSTNSYCSTEGDVFTLCPVFNYA